MYPNRIYFALKVVPMWVLWAQSIYYLGTWTRVSGTRNGPLCCSAQEKVHEKVNKKKHKKVTCRPSRLGLFLIESCVSSLMCVFFFFLGGGGWGAQGLC